MWRVSSTLFSHFRHSTDLTPMRELYPVMDMSQISKYKTMNAYEKLMEELRATSMVSESN